jgi:hypothetical protein
MLRREAAMQHYVWITIPRQGGFIP